MTQPGMGSGNMYRYPSMQSVQSMASIGYMPPGHGYVPKKQKPDKPYGPSFNSIMNRTWRGPGEKYLYYALVCGCVAILFFTGAGTYWGLRNTSRMIVLRTEVWGAILTIIGLCFTGLTFHFIWAARRESNNWRANVRFRPEGLFVAAAYNHAYVPEDGMKLATGTYGPRAVKEIPKPKRAGGRSRRGSQSSVSRVAMANAQMQEADKIAVQPQPAEPAYSSAHPQTHRYAKRDQGPSSHHGSRDYLAEGSLPSYAQVEKTYPQQTSLSTYPQEPPAQYGQRQPPPSPMAYEASQMAPVSYPTSTSTTQYGMRPMTSRQPTTASRGYTMPIQGVPYNSESEM